MFAAAAFGLGCVSTLILRSLTRKSSRDPLCVSSTQPPLLFYSSVIPPSPVMTRIHLYKVHELNDGCPDGKGRVENLLPMTMSRPFSFSFFHGSRLRSGRGSCDSQRWSLPLWVSFCLVYAWSCLVSLLSSVYSTLCIVHIYLLSYPNFTLGSFEFSLFLASMPIIALN